MIRVRSWSFCLGCTGFYSGLLVGIMVGFFVIPAPLDWSILIGIAVFLAMPSIARLIGMPPFSSSSRLPRFAFRVLLGCSVGLGIYSISIAPSIATKLIQVAIGIVVYLAIGFHRVRNAGAWNEICDTCSFERSVHCPGMRPFHDPEALIPNIGWRTEDDQSVVEEQSLLES